MRHRIMRILVSTLLVAVPACGGGGGGEKEPAKSPGKKGAKKEKEPGETPPAKKAEEPEEREVPAGLLEALGSEDLSRRSDAVREIRGYGKDAVGPLVGVLEGEDLRARCGALVCLELIGDPAAREPVEKALSSAETVDEILYSLAALGAVGNSRSVSLARKYASFEAPDRFPEEAGWMVEKARETDRGLVRNQAAETLARLGDTSSVPVLIETLHSNNGWVRKDALVRLRRMTGCKVDFGYNLGEGRPAHARAVAKWEAWWKENGKTFKPEWTDDPEVWNLNKRG